MTKSFQRFVHCVLLSMMAFSANADEWWRFWSDDSVSQQVRVAQPYIDLRSGPAHKASRLFSVVKKVNG